MTAHALHCPAYTSLPGSRAGQFSSFGRMMFRITAMIVAMTAGDRRHALPLK